MPARKNPKGIILVLVTILLSMVSVGLLTGVWGAAPLEATLWAIVAGVFLTANLRTFFLPTCYRLDEHGISIRQWPFTQKRAWSRCKSLHEDRYGVLVSPFAFKTRLENFRGVFLRFSGNREQVMSFCRFHLEKNKEKSNDG